MSSSPASNRMFFLLSDTIMFGDNNVTIKILRRDNGGEDFHNQLYPMHSNYR